jgi:hypothetical protein
MATFRTALNHPEARELIDSIEDMLASWDGENRYAAEIQHCIEKIEKLTGYVYKL